MRRSGKKKKKKLVAFSPHFSSFSCVPLFSSERRVTRRSSLHPSSPPSQDAAVARLLLRGLSRPRRAGELRELCVGLFFVGISGVGGEQLPRRCGVVPRAVPSRRGGQVSSDEGEDLATSMRAYRVDRKYERERESDTFWIPFFRPSIDREPRRASSSLTLSLSPPPRQNNKNNRCTFVVEGYTYNYVVDGSFTFLAVSAER